jgi:hypothetical protein
MRTDFCGRLLFGDVARGKGASSVDAPRSDIFLCYRREQTSDARLVFQALEAQFGSDRIFWDASDIEWGTDYVDRIEQALESSAAMVAIIGKDWLQLDEPNGGIRNPTDSVREEIGRALSARVPIFPTLLEGAQMPDRAALPEDIARFAQIQANRLSNDHWDLDLANLVKRLEPLVGPAKSTTRTGGARQRPRPSSTTTTEQQANRPESVAKPRPAPHPTLATPALDTADTPFFPRGRLIDPSRPPFRLIEPDSPEAREMRARREALKDERAQARLDLPKFYQRVSFWLIGAASIALCLVAALQADAVFGWVTGMLGLQFSSATLPIVAVGLGLIWGVVYVVTGKEAYEEDPRRGTLAFLARGILGGWTLLAGGDVWAGILGAFPVTIFVGWAFGRIVEDVLPVNWVWPGVLAMALYTWRSLGQYTEQAELSYRI